MSSKAMSTCAKCKQSLPRRGFLCCAECQHKYHIECANVSQTRYYIMERRDQWMCTECITKPKKKTVPSKSKALPQPKALPIPKTPPSIDINEPYHGLTRRGAQLQRCKSINDLYEADSHSTMMDLSSISLPENCSNNSEAEEYKKEIEDLKLKLNIANEEIDKLNLEIAELKKGITNRDSKIKILKTVGAIDKSIRKSSTPNKKSNAASSMVDTSIIPRTPVSRLTTKELL